MTELEQEIAHLQELQAKHRKNIRALEEQLASYGMDRPLSLLNKLDFEREQQGLPPLPLRLQPPLLRSRSL